MPAVQRGPARHGVLTGADALRLAARARRWRPALDRPLPSSATVGGRIERSRRVRARVYADPADREVAGFIAAGLAFGRVAGIMASVRAVLAAMGESPAAFVRRFDPAKDAAPLLPFVHRWMRGRDVAALLAILRHMLDEAGSLERSSPPATTPRSRTSGPGLESFCRRARAVDLQRGLRPDAARPGAHAFFPLPSAGSACKRLNLFLRWMVRRDAVDLGAWTRVSPARLIIPLDVHVIRVGQCLRLTRYASPGWRMAARSRRRCGRSIRPTP